MIDVHEILTLLMIAVIVLIYAAVIWVNILGRKSSEGCHHSDRPPQSTPQLAGLRP
jgi:hypothetical protein